MEGSIRGMRGEASEGGGAGVGAAGTDDHMESTARESASPSAHSNASPMAAAGSDARETSTDIAARIGDEYLHSHSPFGSNVSQTVAPADSSNAGQISIANVSGGPAPSSNSPTDAVPSTNLVADYPTHLQPRLLNPHVVHLCVFRSFGVPWRAIIRCSSCPQKKSLALIKYYHLVRQYRLPEWVCGSSRKGMKDFAEILAGLRHASPALELNKIHFLWLMRYGLKFDWTWTIKYFRETFPQDPVCLREADDDLLMVRVVMRVAKDLDRVEEIVEDMAKWLGKGEAEVPAEVIGWLKKFGDGITIERLRQETIGRLVFEADKPAPRSSATTSDSSSRPRDRFFISTSTTEHLLQEGSQPGRNRILATGETGSAYREAPLSDIYGVFGDIASLPPRAPLRTRGVSGNVGGRFRSGLQGGPYTSSALANSATRILTRMLRGAPSPRRYNVRIPYGALRASRGAQPREIRHVYPSVSRTSPPGARYLLDAVHSLYLPPHNDSAPSAMRTGRGGFQGARLPYPPPHVRSTSSASALPRHPLAMRSGLRGGRTPPTSPTMSPTIGVPFRTPVLRDGLYPSRSPYQLPHGPSTSNVTNEPPGLALRPAPPPPRPAVALVDGQYIMVPNPQNPTAGTPPTEWRRGRYAWVGSQEAEERNRLRDRLLGVTPIDSWREDERDGERQ